MRVCGIIGGSGFYQFEELECLEKQSVETPYGIPSAKLSCGNISGERVVFLPRHGDDHSIPPHKINYRANLLALKKSGVTEIISVCAVGGICSKMVPGSIVIPDQVIDYTWGRKHTFYDGELISGSGIDENVNHIDFTNPFSESLRRSLIQSARTCKINVFESAVYAATQGPRLETAAEIDRMEKDGAHIVGMTGMPEAALSRELDIPYACMAMVVNEAAGRGAGELTMELIRSCLNSVSVDAKKILVNLF